MKIKTLSFVPLIIFSSLFLLSMSAQTGIITGKVTDLQTHETLVGVNIIVNELENIGTSTDTDGRFVLKVPVGSYSLKASMVGYKPVIKTDVIVKTESEVNLVIQLSELAIGMDEITVQADYFDKSVLENDLSTVILGAEEVKRSPGSSLDVQRILQGMAGVSFSSDRTNELIVRGGAPDENLIILDNMELHSINHFPSEYNSGGAVNMINIDLVQDIQFSTGGFIAQYGDKLSSVMNIATREGTRNNSFDGNVNVSLAGIGAVMEGSINNGKGAWLFSGRNSFLSLFKNVIGKSGIPVYRDFYFKTTYDLSPRHTITSSAIYGWDKIYEEDEFDDSKISLANKIDSSGITIEDIRQHQYAAGITLSSIWQKDFYSDITLYYNNFHFDINEIEKYGALEYDSKGELSKTTMLNERVLYNDKHNNGEAVLKGEFVWNIGKSNELSFGGAVKTPRYNQSTFIGGDSTRYDIAGDGWNTPDDIYVTEPSSKQEYDIKLFDNLKSYAFINDKIRLLDNRLTLNLGLRYDYFSYSNKGNLSPRISASYYLVTGITSINFAYGDYYQTQSFPLYLDRYNLELNKHLKNTHARHFLIGYEQILSKGLKLTLEGYYKKYTDIPISEEFIHFEDRTFRSKKYMNVGEKTSYGIDLLIQQKLVKDVFGTLAYSRMWSNNKDPRIGREGEEYPSDYEYPHVFIFVLGKRFSNLRDKLDGMPFYIKYTSYILPFSNDMEISVRWRYASGRVYTPKTFVTNEQYYKGGIEWSKGSWISKDEINSKRYPDYHRLDIAFSSRYNFTNWSLTVYLSVENLYNRKNILKYKYNSSGSIKEVYQFSLFPVLGLEVQF